jgi:hypothetical protein
MMNRRYLTEKRKLLRGPVAVHYEPHMRVLHADRFYLILRSITETLAVVGVVGVYPRAWIDPALTIAVPSDPPMMMPSHLVGNVEVTSACALEFSTNQATGILEVSTTWLPEVTQVCPKSSGVTPSTAVMCTNGMTVMS